MKDEIISKKWLKNYNLAKKYYIEHDNLLIPSDYIAPDGTKLGYWIETQRRVRKGKKNGNLTEKQISLLDDIGMIWDVYSFYEEQNNKLNDWNFMYNLAKNYYKQNGNLKIPYDFRTFDGNKFNKNGYKLGSWLGIQKNLYTKRKLDLEKARRLNLLDHKWYLIVSKQRRSLIEVRWNYMYDLLSKYYKTNNSLKMEKNFRTKDGVNECHNGARISSWYKTQKRKYIGELKSLNDYQIEKMEKLNPIWFNENDDIKLQKEVITSHNTVRKKIEILNRCRSYLLKYDKNSLPNKDEINKKFIKYLEKH